jgi:effector-binding domain-containing protein
MLTLKRAEIQQVIESEQERLVRIEARLRQIEQEHLVSEYDVILKSVAAQRVAAIRGLILLRGEIGAWMSQSFQNILTFLHEHRASQRAHGIALWHDQEYREEDLDAEAAIPTTDALPPHPRVHSYELPAVETMACTVHQGSFSTLDRAYAALFAWVGENGYVVCGATREFYLHFAAGDAPSSFVTELQFPVRKGAAPSSSAP